MLGRRLCCGLISSFQTTKALQAEKQPSIFLTAMVPLVLRLTGRGTEEANRFQTRSNNKELADSSNLLADRQSADRIQVQLWINAAKVIQQTTSLADQCQQTTTAGIILGMRSHMLSQRINAFGQQRYLNYGRSCVSTSLPILFYQALLALCRYRHGFVNKSLRWPVRTERHLHAFSLDDVPTKQSLLHTIKHF